MRFRTIRLFFCKRVTVDVQALIVECRKLEREFANTFYLDTSKKERMLKLKTVC